MAVIHTPKIDFFENGLCLHCHMAKQELHEFIQFHTETEKFWKDSDDELNKKIDDILKKYPKEHHDDIVESYGWELHQNQYKFPDIHRKSILITIYGFLESDLNKLCKIISECIDNKIKLRYLSGKGISRALLYLSKIAEIDKLKFGNELIFIKKTNLLRNCIVHAGGVLPDQEKHELNIFVTQNKNLSGCPGDTVSLGPDFIAEFIDNLLIFYEKMHGELQVFMNKVNA